jgi:hypothetical protein
MKTKKSKITNSLTEDLIGNLTDVQRWWIRIPCTIILTPVGFVVILMIDIATTVIEAIKGAYWFFCTNLKGSGEKRMKKLLESL